MKIRRYEYDCGCVSIYDDDHSYHWRCFNPTHLCNWYDSDISDGMLIKAKRKSFEEIKDA